MKRVILGLLSLSCFIAAAALAQGTGADQAGVGKVAHTVTTNLGNIARLVTAASYVAGMAFVVGAIVKFKGHKDNPTQIPISHPIVFLFMGAALIFVPTVFNVAGGTLFGTSGTVAGISGIVSFGATRAG